MNVARTVSELERKPRAVALGTFDGVHLGHRRVIEAALAAGPTPTVVTFDPHPRRVLGYAVEQLCTLERRLELFADLGVEDTLVVEFTLDTQRIEAKDFAEQYLRAIGAEVVVAGEDFRFGHKRRGDLDAAARSRLRRATGAAARGRVLVGRPPPAPRGPRGRGRCTAGPATRGRRDGGRGGCARGHARLSHRERRRRPGAARASARHLRRVRGRPEVQGRRAAVSIGVNPHYGGDELRIEAFLLGFAGDLYGKRLVVELWRRLRDEEVFDSEQALIDQIARDVDATKRAERPG